MLDLIGRLAKRGIGVLVVSHNLTDVFQVADRLAVLYLGRLVSTGPASDYDTASAVDLMTTGATQRTGARTALPAPPTAARRADHWHPGIPTPSRAPSTTEGTSPTAGRRRGPARRAPELLAGSVGEYVRLWLKRIRSGESGALPVIVGLIVIVLIFQVKSSLFLSAGNLVNLMTQAAFIITLGMAEVFVLLLGEIDLAAGFTAACGAVIALYLVAKNYPWWVAVLACLAATGAYGAVQGYIITRLRLPSFVVTLAGFLGLSGLLLFLIDATGKIGVGGVIRLNNNILNDIESARSTRPPAGS